MAWLQLHLLRFEPLTASTILSVTWPGVLSRYNDPLPRHNLEAAFGSLSALEPFLNSLRLYVGVRPTFGTPSVTIRFLRSWAAGSPDPRPARAQTP